MRTTPLHHLGMALLLSSIAGIAGIGLGPRPAHAGEDCGAASPALSAAAMPAALDRPAGEASEPPADGRIVTVAIGTEPARRDALAPAERSRVISYIILRGLQGNTASLGLR